ncbi:MAG: PaaI family thioesterase [Myxococcales bacterium]|nr:PaaI family thioesterase [Myxococcales bacterium]
MSDEPRVVGTLASQLQAFHKIIPHNRALGLEILTTTDGRAHVRLPYRPEFVGDPHTGVLHGGVITSLLDATFGLSAFMALPRPVSIATLDLRIDYLRPATPGATVHARGECYRLTRSVAFVRGIAYHDDEDSPIASGAATFMLANRPRRDARATGEVQP